MRPGPSWGKKDKHGDPSKPGDPEPGSYGDHVLIDAGSRRLVTLVIGRRETQTARQAFADFYRGTDGDLIALMTSDEYTPDWTVIVQSYGVAKEDVEQTEEPKVEYDYASLPEVYFPVEMAYATVHKERESGPVVKGEQRVVLGTEPQVAEALAHGSTSPTITTNDVERYQATQRHFNARKARKVYTFSKELVFQVAVTWLCVTFDNFGWMPRTLREQVPEEPPRYRYRTPAMAAGLTDHAWSMAEILTYPLFPVGQRPKNSERRHCENERPEGG